MPREYFQMSWPWYNPQSTSNVCGRAMWLINRLHRIRQACVPRRIPGLSTYPRIRNRTKRRPQSLRSRRTQHSGEEHDTRRMGSLLRQKLRDNTDKNGDGNDGNRPPRYYYQFLWEEKLIWPYIWAGGVYASPIELALHTRFVLIRGY